MAILFQPFIVFKRIYKHTTQNLLQKSIYNFVASFQIFLVQCQIKPNKRISIDCFLILGLCPCSEQVTEGDEYRNV